MYSSRFASLGMDSCSFAAVAVAGSFDVRRLVTLQVFFSNTLTFVEEREQAILV